MAVQNFKDLVAWQKAMDLVVRVYTISESFPKSEAFGLTNQVRRAAVSIPSNIAEGQGRGATPDFARILRIAKGSVQEVDTQLTLAVRLNFISQKQYEESASQLTEVLRLLHGLIRSIDPNS